MKAAQRHVRVTVAVSATLTCLLAGTSLAQSQPLHMLVDSATGTGGNAIGTFGYDPTTDAYYVSSFGAGATLRRVTGVSTGTPTSATLLAESGFQLFYRDGDPNRSVSTPSQSGMLLNPKAVGSAPAYSFAFVTDLATTRVAGSSTPVDPAASKRVYTYNLGAPPAGGDGRDVFGSRVTLATLQAAAPGSTGTTSNTGRQFAWSGDGQSIYFLDSSSPTTSVGGVWKLPAAGGAPVRLLAQDDLLTEPAVVAGGGVDKIYFRGGGSTANLNGIDFITHDGTTTSARQVAVTAATLRDFLELPATASVAVAAMSSDADGNVYFVDTTGATGTTVPDRRGLYKLDPQGRLSKVVGYAQRQAALGGSPNSNMNRQQPRTVTYDGTAGSFLITQVLYAENHIDAVVGADVFKTGDFNRDNLVTTADVALFKTRLTPRGQAPASTADLIYDLNGSNSVDWKDVKVLQQFYPFDDGDADIDGKVDYVDLDAMRANYLAASGKTWVQGDFNGDGAVTAADLTPVAFNWDLTTPTFADLDAHGYTGQFRTDVAQAFGLLVPEPGSATIAGAMTVGLLAARRRRKGDAIAHGGGLS